MRIWEWCNKYSARTGRLALTKSKLRLDTGRAKGEKAEPLARSGFHKLFNGGFEDLNFVVGSIDGEFEHGNHDGLWRSSRVDDACVGQGAIWARSCLLSPEHVRCVIKTNIFDQPIW